MNISLAFVERGQERYNIYCAVCHGKTGQGNGIVIQRNVGMLKPPSFNEDRLVNMPAGQIYDSIINGVRGNMPSYAYAIPLEDRWAIVAYVQALQLSQRGSIDNVPSDLATSKGWKR
jgi:mono/diheme cytochrome c family protein